MYITPDYAVCVVVKSESTQEGGGRSRVVWRKMRVRERQRGEERSWYWLEGGKEMLRWLVEEASDQLVRINYHSKFQPFTIAWSESSVGPPYSRLRTVMRRTSNTTGTERQRKEGSKRPQYL